jgi:hypothetical protein
LICCHDGKKMLQVLAYRHFLSTLTFCSFS